ncbi:hypothetical protein DSO57_1033942 [Entomophthora muscae]|uniref:Uncharacterized protein n=1 Tax=Entomophthora muscae TaxID=34485 RepID=A0ACC2TXV1_9FUNG|nr:hypothetical protein DSO57_1033942 [Entomophthora muscae]
MSIQTLHSSATSSIQACLAFGSKILPWLSLNALAAAVIPFQVVANACFFSFSSRSSPTDKACFSGISATLPANGEEPDILMFVGAFFMEPELPLDGRPQRDPNSQPCRIGNHPIRTAPTPNPLDLDDELSLMFNTNCHI